MRKGNWQIKNSRRAFVSATPDFTLLNSAIEFSDNPFYLFSFWNLWSDILWGAILVDQNFCPVWLFASEFSPAKLFSEFSPNTKLYLETGKIYEPWLIHISLEIIANIMKQPQIFIEFWYPRYSLKFIYKKKSFMFQNYDIIIKAIFVHSFLIHHRRYSKKTDDQWWHSHPSNQMQCH